MRRTPPDPDEAQRRARRRWFTRPLHRDGAFQLTIVVSLVFVAAMVALMAPRATTPLHWVALAFYAAFICVVVALLVSLPVRVLRAWYGSHREAEEAAGSRGGPTGGEKVARLGGKALGTAMARRQAGRGGQEPPAATSVEPEAEPARQPRGDAGPQPQAETGLAAGAEAEADPAPREARQPRGDAGPEPQAETGLAAGAEAEAHPAHGEAPEPGPPRPATAPEPGAGVEAGAPPEVEPAPAPSAAAPRPPSSGGLAGLARRSGRAFGAFRADQKAQREERDRS